MMIDVLAFIGLIFLTAHFERVIEVRGQVLWNAPDDSLELVLFPKVTAFFSNHKRLQASREGLLKWNELPELFGKISLQNPYVKVVHAKNFHRYFPFDLTASPEENIDLSSGPSLAERNVYYWLMKAHHYVTQKLKYDGLRDQILAVVHEDQISNGVFYNVHGKTLFFGEGGELLKNVAYSRDIILHEYSHILLDSLYGPQKSYEEAVMKEALSDYFAATITHDPQIAEGVFHNSVEHPYVRTLENVFRFPENYYGNCIYEDSQIFSGALWDLRQSMGFGKANQIIHQAQLARPTTIFKFYKELLKIDESQDDLNPFTPSPHHRLIRKAFFKHGLGHADVHLRQMNLEEHPCEHGFEKKEIGLSGVHSP